MMGKLLYTLLAISLILTPALATASCFISGHITAGVNTTAPQYGAWKYTLNVTWDTGSRYGLSHFNLFIDDGMGACTCAAIDAGIHWINPIGSSTGVPSGCTVNYNGNLECSGDPSIDYFGTLLKFEPIQTPGCEPGPTGTGTFVFYSEYPPAPIALDNLFLTDKAGQTSCSGMVTGVFPGLPCDPTENESSTWGNLKALYGN